MGKRSPVPTICRTGAILAVCVLAAVRASSQVTEATALQFVGTAGPNASIAQIDLGQIDPIRQPSLTQAFRLRNAGTAPLRIERVEASCGCTTVLIDGRPLEDKLIDVPARGTITLEAIHDFYLIRPGQMTKFIWVYLEGQKSPSAIVEIKLDLKPCIRFYPETLVFGRVKSGTSSSLHLRVDLDSRLLPRGHETPPALASSDSDIRVDPERASSAGAVDPGMVRRAYTITLSPTASLGVHFATLSYPPSTGGGTDADPKKLLIAQVSAGVQAVVDGRISANPAVALFGAVVAGKEHVHSVALTGRDSNALKGLSVLSAAPWISARVIPEPGSPLHATLELRADASAPAGSHQTQVVLRTSDGQRMILPVTIYIAPAASVGKTVSAK